MGGFNEDLSAKTIGAPLPSPPLHHWVRGWVVGVVVCGFCVGLFGLHIWVLRFLILCIVCSWLRYLEGDFFFFFFPSWLLVFWLSLRLLWWWLWFSCVMMLAVGSGSGGSGLCEVVVDWWWWWLFFIIVDCERPCPRPPFLGVLGQTHVNGWNRVIASQNGGSTSYIYPFRLRVLQWSRHLINYWDK